MKKMLWLIVVSLVGIAGLGACASPEQQAEKAVNTTAQELNTILAQIYTDTAKLSQKMTQVYAQADQYDLSTATMDVANGGNYKFYKDTAYYKAVSDGQCSLWASGFVPVDEQVKQHIRLLEYAQPDCLATVKTSPYILTVQYIATDGVAMVCPHVFNFIESTPLKVDFTASPYGQAIGPALNPGRQGRWFEPSVAIAGAGWSLKNFFPIYQGDTWRGMLGDIVDLSLIQKNLLEPSPYKLTLMTADTTFTFSANAAFKAALPQIKVPEPYHYLEQLSANITAGSEYKLNQSRDTEIQSLAERLKTETKFKITLGGKTYTVIRADIPEVNWYLVAFID